MSREHSTGYDVEGVLPVESITTLRAGTNVLISGPAHVGKAELGRQLLVRAATHDEDAIAISTDGELAPISRAFARRADGDSRSQLSLVDCSQGPRSAATELPAGEVTDLNSPVDMTGIGIALAKYDEERGEAAAGTRLLFDSLTTLLLYVDHQRAYQFVDVMTGRFTAADYLSVFLLDDTAVDTQVANMFVHEFDAQIKLRETDGTREIALRGFPEASADWRPYEPDFQDPLQQ